MKSVSSFIVFILLIALMAGGWFWLEQNRPETPTELRETPATRVEITKVAREDILPLTKITGRLVPVRRTKLHFEVSGQVMERLVEPGQKVNTGSELIRIDAGDFEDVQAEMLIQLDQEKQVIARDQKLLSLANRQTTLLQREVNRLEKLRKQSLIAQTKIDEINRQFLSKRSEQAQLQHSVQTAESRLKMRELALHKAQRNMQRTVLKAPVDATINSIEVSVGDYVSPGQAVIELVQLDELELRVDAAGKDVAALKLDQPVGVIIDGKKYQGKLSSFQYDPDPVTHTHALKIRLNGDGLFPGQLGEVHLTGQPMKGVLVVPITAVISEDGESYLFRLMDQDRVSRSAITVLGRHEDQLIISGVEANDQIVARDVSSLEDGQKVVVD
jgi:RND family efflux transporter MFP subunit